MGSTAQESFNAAVGHARRLIEGISDASPKETSGSMAVAAVVMTYAAWEGYIEDVAIELAMHLSGVTDTSRIPDTVRRHIEAMNPTMWEFSVEPGYRGLWVRSVKEFAKGTEGKVPTFGMNTAGVKQVRALFERVGLPVWRHVPAADIHAIDDLVSLRGQIAHSGTAPDDFTPAKARECLDLVERVVETLESALYSQTMDLCRRPPWHNPNDPIWQDDFPTG